MSRHPMKDVVVVLPGILGSALEKDGKAIWDMSPGAAIRALFTLGGSVKDLTLDGDDHTADDLGDGVRATRLLPDLHLLPGLWKIDGYSAIAKRLQAQFDLVSGENYFEFAYDWRRDNRVAARKLARMSHDWLKAWREKTGNDDAKLVLLAHSMGGLVSRAFLELEGGWKDTRTLVTFGTPYRGSLNAASFIANGFKKKIGPLTVVDLTEMLRSLTSVYQLLPIYPCIDEGGPGPVRPAETTTFPNLDTGRAGEALAFHRGIEEAVSQHSTETAYVENRYRIEPVVGADQPTLNSGRVDGDRLLMSRSIDGDCLLGDGTVPRPSAHPQESDDATDAVFSGEPHASIQNQKGVLDHVAGLMTVGALDLGRYRKPSLRLGLILDDFWEADVGAELTVETNEPAGQIGVEVIDAATSEVVERVVETGRGTERIVQIPGVSPGAYRVRVGSPDVSVTDVVLVA